MILGGRGAVGRLFADLLRGEGTVTLADLRPGVPVPGTSALEADARRPDPRLAAELAVADAVIVALPEEAGVAAVEAAARHMPRGAVLVETLSVKSAVAGALARGAAEHGLEALGVNPMFAPALGFPGRPVLVSRVRGGPRSHRLETLIEDAGGRLVPVEIGEHDRLTAALQVATHAGILAFGGALRLLGADAGALTRAAPPPHRAMLALLARVVSGTPEVYRDVQAANPYAGEARKALADALGRVDEAAREPSGRFDEMLGDLAGWLGPERERLAVECADLFTHLSD
ncbi:prephenate dehydrogenase dimerization domain-containing protein [Actinomadura sp. KC216]|uniref:prephenate dehydrogenase dimerization domain-containing protein n=1 Tax=Actinomadura sp. KC216 TaxID=2530370 RepID=UPI001404D55C|nr:prephenate dehydrogenase dimerization domain-containing protein [Actinomadura sp. KC216]